MQKKFDEGWERGARSLEQGAWGVEQGAWRNGDGNGSAGASPHLVLGFRRGLSASVSRCFGVPVLRYAGGVAAGWLRMLSFSFMALIFCWDGPGWCSQLGFASRLLYTPGFERGRERGTVFVCIEGKRGYLEVFEGI